VFLSLGLYKFEYKKLKLIFVVLVCVWLCSVVFLNKVLLPFSWAFFLSYPEQNKNFMIISLFFEAKLNEYFEYYKNLYYICVLNSQFLALIVFGITFLSKDFKKVKKFRRIFYFIFIFFSTTITPPDIFSQFFLSSLFIVFYELLIFLQICLKSFKLVTN
jgi:Sec-independent protein secretion pathway component TatC